TCCRSSRNLLYRCFYASRRRHTSFSRDWSSDVCSSDLALGVEVDGADDGGEVAGRLHGLVGRLVPGVVAEQAVAGALEQEAGDQIGRASCRERVEAAVVAGS